MTAVDRYRAAEARLWASLGHTPNEQVLHLRGTDTGVRVQTVGEGAAVVFIHGANTSGASWASLAARLPGFRCILVDRPGTGLSDPLRRPLTADGLEPFADRLVVDLLDALGLESAHLIATSFGGYIALRTAAMHAHRVGRMVEFSWPAGTPTERIPMFMRVMTVPGLGQLLAALPANERSARMTFRRIGHGPSLDAGRITREDIECYVSMLRDTGTMRNELALGRALMSPRRGLDRVWLSDDALAAIRAPTLLIWGANDPFGGADTAARLKERLHDAQLVMVPGGGHAPWLDDLEGCAQAVVAFLDGPATLGG